MIYCLILIGLCVGGPILVIGVCAGLGAIIGYIVAVCSFIYSVLAPIFRLIMRVINFLRRPKKRKGVK